MEVRVSEEPPLDQRRLVGSVVVEDQMDICMARDVAVDVVEELAELDAAMAPMMFSDDLAALDVEGRKERGRAVAHVVVGAPLDLTGPHREYGLTAVQGLDLRLLVDTKHNCTVGRIQVEADDVPHLLNQQRVGREFEALASVRPQAKGTPNASDACPAKPGALGQRARAPVGGVFGLGLQSQRDDPLDRAVTDLAWRTRPSLVDKPIQAALDEPPPPATYGLSGYTQPLGYLPIVVALNAGQNDSRTQRQRLSRRPSPHPRFQSLPLLRAHTQGHFRTPSSHRHPPSTGEQPSRLYSSSISVPGH